MNAISRRSLLAGAAAATVCGTAVASAAGPDPVVALADHWIEMDKEVSSTSYATDEELDAACDQLDPVIDEIIATPAQDITGLAAKLQVLERYTRGWFQSGDLVGDVFQSIADDARRLARA